ncbi:MAG: outer membrane lipoprotein carrier protein LolA [Acidobacteriota bacterium]|nr:MAG: outer membrane lipoprotein carrier protein LolA [Acidobacteriota bacterium]
MPYLNEPALGTRAARRVLVLLLSLSLAVCGAGLAEPDRAARKSRARADAGIQKILDRIDEAQRSMNSLRAELVETRHMAMLAEPQVFKGTLLFQRPGNIRWEYREPEIRTYVLSDGQLTGWIPSRNEIETISISRSERRIRRLVAIGEDTSSLRREFQVTLNQQADEPNSAELVLIPKSRRIRKRIAEIRLWIDREAGLPRRVRYTSGEGDVIELEMVQLTVNPPISEGTFELSIPPGAKVVRGLASMGFPGAS